MSSENAIAPDVAEQEFMRFVTAMDLDVDTTGMDADDIKSLDDAKRKLTRAMLRGSLVIDEDGRPVFTPQLGDRKPITFNEPTGDTLRAMDGLKKGQDVAKTMTVLAKMTAVKPDVFSNMVSRDLKVCQAILALFMG